MIVRMKRAGKRSMVPLRTGLIKVSGWNTSGYGWMYLFVAQIEEFVEFNATVRKSPEGSLFLELCGKGGVGH